MNLNSQVENYLKQLQTLEIQNSTIKSHREQLSPTSQQSSPKYEETW